MLYVLKSGATQYGNWAFGTLKFKGLEIKDIFQVTLEVKNDQEYKVEKIEVKRTKKGQLRFKVFIQ